MINIYYNAVHDWVYKEWADAMVEALQNKGFDANASGLFGSNAKSRVEKGRGRNVPFSKFNIFIEFREPPEEAPEAINIYCETDHINMPARIKNPVNYSAFTRSLHYYDYGKDLRAQNIYYCPLGYSKSFDTNIKKTEVRNTFSFGRSGSYGVREAFRKKYNIYTVGSNGAEGPIIPGDARDALIMSSKVNINSRIMFPQYFFTPLHATLILSKGKMLMQEDYGLDEFNFYKKYLILFTEEDFKEKLDYWVSHDKERREFENFIYEDFRKNHKFEDIFYNSLKGLL